MNLLISWWYLLVVFIQTRRLGFTSWQVLINCLISDLTLIFYTKQNTNKLSVFNLLVFYILQDLYFYTVHRFLFHGILWKFHAKHHKIKINPADAWNATLVEHICLNLGSVVVPWLLFPNCNTVLYLLVMQQVYTSVNGHKEKSPHSVHHRYKKRYGSIYLFDRIFNTY